MSNYPYSINDLPFYITQNLTWQKFGILENFSVGGRPNPNGQASFTMTVRAMAYDSYATTNAGQPFETSGTFKQLFAAWQASPEQQTYKVPDPTTGDLLTVTGILDIAKLLETMPGGVARQDVQIKVDNVFPVGTSRSTYFGGDPFPDNSTAPYIPGDPLPPEDPTRTYGWNVGGWNEGTVGKGKRHTDMKNISCSISNG
jgi:hypothetical protein